MRTLGTERSRLFTRAFLISILLLLSCHLGAGFIRGGMLGILTASALVLLLVALPRYSLGSDSNLDALIVVMFAGAFILINYMGTGFRARAWSPVQIEAAFSASLGCVIVLQVLFPVLRKVERRNRHLIDRKLLFLMLVLFGMSWIVVHQRGEIRTLRDGVSELRERQKRAEEVQETIGDFVAKIVLVDREGNRHRWKPPGRKERR